MEDVEIWKDIQGLFFGLYQVSNMGRVKSLAKQWIGGKGAKNSKPETILKLVPSKNGYLFADLYNNGKRKNCTVHRLVWEAFNGPTNLQIDHIIEGDKRNNRLDNLQELTPRKNSSKYTSSLIKTSQFTGVHLNNGKWVAQITIGKKIKHLGVFSSELSASNAYQSALKSIK